MNLETKVCAFELAQKLKALGVKQESIFYWGKFCSDDVNDFEFTWRPEYVNRIATIGKIGSEDSNTYSAFTSAELGDILPNNVTTKDGAPFDNFRINITKFISIDGDSLTPINNYIVNYECDSTEVTGDTAWCRRRLADNIYDPNLANAMAKMLIYLIENGLINPSNSCDSRGADGEAQ